MAEVITHIVIFKHRPDITWSGFVLGFENQVDLDYYLTEDPVDLEFSRNAAPLM